MPEMWIFGFLTFAFSRKYVQKIVTFIAFEPVLMSTFPSRTMTFLKFMDKVKIAPSNNILCAC
jgi:hypothetical protein